LVLNRGKFQITGFDEGGVKGTPENLRLVCLTDSDGKLAVWGAKASRRNIDKILRADLPCQVECEWRAPNPTQARKFGHRFWVREDCELNVLSSGAAKQGTWSVLEWPEPQRVYPEAEFEAAVVGLIDAGLKRAGIRFQIVPKFGVDIALFVQGAIPRVLFVEAKSFGGQRQGGVGFGNSKGEGSQVELLIEPPTDLLNGSVRWVFADATQSVGAPRYAFFDCLTARSAAMGSVARGKQNNLRVSALKPHLVDWSRFCSQVLSFVGAGEPTT
jgi:hypothetical protein